MKATIQVEPKTEMTLEEKLLGKGSLKSLEEEELTIESMVQQTLAKAPSMPIESYEFDMLFSEDLKLNKLNSTMGLVSNPETSEGGQNDTD